jgi:hypothetical protein
MKRFFVQDNGRLKTGRVALVVFMAAIAGCSLIFYLGKPADKVLIAVKHVFEAEEAPLPEVDQSSDAVQSPEPERAEVTGPDEATVNETEKLLSEEENLEPSAKKEQTIDTADDNSIEEKELVEEAAVVAHDNVKSEPPSPRFEPLPGFASKEQPKEMDAAGEAILPAKEYAAVHAFWRESGSRAAGEGGMPLRIENLRKVYPLFQMKAVALRGDTPYVDLSDGTRIAEGALTPYSNTCFLVTDPFNQWGDALKKAGFTPGSNVSVRYYMYDSVRNAIYARAFRAFECSREKGLIAGDLTPDSVDILGRAFAIRREGGGSFGVFVPIRIDLPDGGNVAVDPSCFAGSPDIDYLIAATQLR